jgi:O-antigen/teichoic acid export membrane protein
VSVLQRIRTSGILGVGSAVAVSSVAGYALLAVVGRTLTTSEFALFMSFWGLLFGLASSMSMVEQEAARQSAGHEKDHSAPILRVAVGAGAIATAAAALTLVPAISVRFYGHTESGMGLLVVAATIGFAAQFMVRGLLMGSDDIRGYSGLVVAEPIARLVVLLLVWLTVGVTLGSAAAAVAVGAFAWLGWIGPTRRLLRANAVQAGFGLRSWLDPLRRASSLMLGAALNAALITGYTTLVTAFSGGAPGAAGGAVFAALTVSRVPLLFVAPLQALAVPTILRWQQDDSNTAKDAHRFVALAATGTLVIGLVGGLVAWFIGPWAVQIALGEKYLVSSATMAALVFSACILGLLQLASTALIALGRYRWMTIVWATATGSTALWLLLNPFDIVLSTVVGTLVGPIVGVCLALVVLWRMLAQRVSTVADHA